MQICVWILASTGISYDLGKYNFTKPQSFHLWNGPNIPAWRGIIKNEAGNAHKVSNTVVLSRGRFGPRGYSTMAGDIFGCHKLRMLLASSK